MFDYDEFNQNKLSSDLRIKKLFPNDIQKWVRCRDFKTEELLLDDYRLWASDLSQMDEDPAR